MARPISIPELTAEEKQILEQRVRAPTTPQRDSLRARIVLLRAEGLSQKEVARHLQISRPRVNQWSQRFEREGLAGLGDRPRSGRPPSLPAATVQRVIEAASQAPPGRARWSTRTLAAHLGIVQGSVARIWRSQNLKPHLQRTCKLSHDPQFETKFWDVVVLLIEPEGDAQIIPAGEEGVVSNRSAPAGGNRGEGGGSLAQVAG